MNYYDLLEVSVNASDETISAAYKAMVKKYGGGPDGGATDEDSSRKLKEIEEAFYTLSDPEKRARYDEEQGIRKGKSSHQDAADKNGQEDSAANQERAGKNKKGKGSATPKSKRMRTLLFAAVAVVALAGIAVFCIVFDVFGFNHPSRVVVAEVNGVKYYLSQFDEYFSILRLQNGITNDYLKSSDYKDTILELEKQYLQNFAEEMLVYQKAEELGFADLTDEEKQQAEDAIDQELASLLDSIKSDLQENALTTMTDEELEEKAQAEMESYLASYSVTRQMLVEDYMKTMVYQKLYNYLTADASVTEDEIKSAYDEKVASAKETYEAEGGLQTFEKDYASSITDGTAIYYVPAGLRLVKQILIALPEDIQTQISDLRESGDDEGADALLEQSLADIADEANEALALAQSGEDFDTLIEKYNDDEGVKTYPDGYMVAPDSTTYVSSFTEGAFSIGEVGGISGLIASDYGYHILKLVKITEAGEVGYDSVKDTLQEELLEDKKSSIWSDQIDAWVSEASITTYADRVRFVL